MCTTPNETCLRSFFLNVFFLPFFSGAAAPPAAAGFAINRPWSLVVGNHTSNKSSESQSFVVTKRCIAARALAKDQRPTTPLRLRRRFSLLCYRSLTRSLAGTRVGMRTLAADGQVTTMTKAAIGTDFDEPLYAHRNFLAQIALHHPFTFNDLANAVYFVFAKVLDLLHRINVRLIEYASCPRLPDSVDVSQRDKRALIARKIDACNSCHIFSLPRRLK